MKGVVKRIIGDFPIETLVVEQSEPIETVVPNQEVCAICLEPLGSKRVTTQNRKVIRYRKKADGDLVKIDEKTEEIILRVEDSIPAVET